MPIVCLICGTAGPGRVPLCHTHRERWRRWGCPPVEDWATRFREGRLSTCCICGKSFNGYRNRMTCPDNPECERERRRRAGLANFYARSPEQRLADLDRAKSRSRERRAKTLSEKPCRVCGMIFVGLPKQILCSEPCRAVRRNMQAHEWLGRQRSAEQLDKITLLLESRNGNQSPETAAPHPQPGDGA